MALANLIMLELFVLFFQISLTSLGPEMDFLIYIAPIE